MRGFSCRSEAQQRRGSLCISHAEWKLASPVHGRCLMPFTKHRHISSKAVGLRNNFKGHQRGSQRAVPQAAQQSTNESAKQSEDNDKELLSVRIRTKHSVRFGEVIRTVGAGDALGDWDANQAPGMTWSEGDEWAVDLQVPPGIYDFKCVVTRSDGSIAEWEPGKNRTFRVPDSVETPGQVLEVVCPWSNTSSTFMSFDEDDAAQRLEDAHEGIQTSNTDRGGENPAASTLNDVGEGLSRLQGSPSTSSQDVEEKVDNVAEALETPQNGSAKPSSSGNGTQLEASLSRQLEQSSPGSGTPTNGSSSTAGGSQNPQIEKDTQIDGNLTIASSTTDRTSEARKPELRGVQETSDVASPSASKQEESTPATFTQGFLGIIGLLAVPVVLFSEVTLKQTGCGLPPGPSGYLGAVEGVSYLAVGALALWGVVTKLTRGRGLPKGPGGVLGAAEGLSYAAIVLGAIVLGSQYKEYGYIPSALPDSNCFGSESTSSSSEDSISNSVGQQVSNTLQNMKGMFLSGPESSREYSSSGAEDGLSSAELEPVVEELENAAARFGEFLNSLRQSLTPIPAAFRLQDHTMDASNVQRFSSPDLDTRWDAVASEEILKSTFGEQSINATPLGPSPPIRYVGMEMSFNLAATTATTASNNVTLGLNEHVLQLKAAADSLNDTSKALTEDFAAKAETTGDSPQLANDIKQEIVENAEENVVNSSSLKKVVQQLNESATSLRTDMNNADTAQRLEQASQKIEQALRVDISADQSAAGTLDGNAGEAQLREDNKPTTSSTSSDSGVLKVKMFLEEAAEVLSSIASQEHVSADGQAQSPE